MNLEAMQISTEVACVTSSGVEMCIITLECSRGVHEKV
jgi:hypothetical protein